MKRSALVVALFALSVSAPLQMAFAETAQVPDSRAEIQLSFAPVVKETSPSVVNIYASRVVEERLSPFASDPFFSQFFRSGPARQRVQRSLGSGVIVSDSGLVVSNYHVVGEASDISVVLSDRREYEGRVILADKDADVAVLQLEGAEDLPALPLADSDALEVGDLVLAIGNPFGSDKPCLRASCPGWRARAAPSPAESAPISRPMPRSTRAIPVGHWSTWRDG